MAFAKNISGRTRMVDRRQVLVGAVLAASVVMEEALAQTSPAPAAAPPAAPYAITYIEVDPARIGAARQALARYRDALKDKGALELAVFEQIGRPNHFAIVEQWPSAKAREDHAASGASRELHAALAPLLIAPNDERPHVALTTGPKPATQAGVYVITHVDVVPTKRDEGTAESRKIAEASRGSAGNIRFDALVQASRPNHLTLVEAWTGSAAQEAHSATVPAKAFRTALGPIGGSLYDERLYTLLN